MERVLTCILNEKAGSNSAAEARALITQVAAKQGWEARILISSGGADLNLLAAEARADGGLVVGGGGDGTIAAVAAALVGTDTALGVLPMGTLNHFAKDLGIPIELEKAVRTLFTGKVARVDVGEVNGRIFLNNSSIGFYPSIVQEREREQRQGRGKWVAFARAAALRVRAVADAPCRTGRRSQRSSVLRHAFRVHRKQPLRDGRPGDRHAGDPGWWQVVGLRRALCRSVHLGCVGDWGAAGVRRDEDIVALETEQTNVRMHRDHVHVATDGEVNLMRTPLHYRSRPGALRVIVPASD